MLSRRVFIRNGALAAIGMAGLPGFLERVVFAETSSARDRRLVVIFQRGAADGLNIVVPHGESAYYRVRPNIAIPRGQVIDLDGHFGLHPSLAAFKPLFEQKHLAIIDAVGSPDPTRSHFDAQDYMESGTPGIKSTEDGWLNRALSSTPVPASQPGSPFRGIALGPSLPRALSGSAPAVAVANIDQFGVAGNSPASQPLSTTFEAMYSQSVDTVLHGTAQETFDAVKMLKSINPSQYRPAAGVFYPRGRFADSLRQCAQLIKANVGVQVAFVDIGGWDHHVNEGSTQGQLANRLTEFSQSITAFWNDLGSLADETLILTMTEFGRTAHENGNRGTDHGHGSLMFALGGPVRGGRVYGAWPGLEEHQLHEGRDLNVTTDFRHVVGEAVRNHLGDQNLKTVFPGFDSSPHKFLGYIGERA
ncbi:MAG TPA: DUF1501 domain-containing protein [candidate division Zixibacteria bacterium]|nr:DUF1501 domain-containing protein [candidate division Zixibacteria bacterium]